MRGIKIPQQDFTLKILALKILGGGLCARGGGGHICGTLRYIVG